MTRIRNQCTILNINKLKRKKTVLFPKCSNAENQTTSYWHVIYICNLNKPNPHHVLAKHIVLRYTSTIKKDIPHPRLIDGLTTTNATRSKSSIRAYKSHGNASVLLLITPLLHSFRIHHLVLFYGLSWPITEIWQKHVHLSYVRLLRLDRLPGGPDRFVVPWNEMTNVIAPLFYSSHTFLFVKYHLTKLLFMIFFVSFLFKPA